MSRLGIMVRRRRRRRSAKEVSTRAHVPSPVDDGCAPLQKSETCLSYQLARLTVDVPISDRRVQQSASGTSCTAARHLRSDCPCARLLHIATQRSSRKGREVRARPKAPRLCVRQDRRRDAFRGGVRPARSGHSSHSMHAGNIARSGSGETWR